MVTPSFNLTATERVLPRLALDFTTASLDARVTFTRSGNTATRVNSSGFIEGINADLPRFDFNPITLACKGLLIEESRINLCLYSDDLQSSTGVWGLTSCTSTANDVDGPDGTLSAEKLTATGSFPRLAQTITLADNTNYTMSIFVKKGDAYVFSLFATNKANTTTQTFFDVDAGTVTSGTGTITPYKNGFYRCTMTFNSASGGTTPVLRFVNNAQGVTGGWSGSNYLYAYGGQFEAGAFATSYIPTTSAALTRNADVATMTGTNFSDWFNASEGTFDCAFVPQAAISTASTAQLIIEADSGGSAERFRPFRNNDDGKIFLSNTTGGVTNVSAIGGTVVSTGSATSVSAAYKLDNFGIATNGGAAATDTSATVCSPTQLRIGSGYNNANYLNGTMSKLSYYPQRLTNAELQAFSKG